MRKTFFKSFITYLYSKDIKALFYLFYELYIDLVLTLEIDYVVIRLDKKDYAVTLFEKLDDIFSQNY